MAIKIRFGRVYGTCTGCGKEIKGMKLADWNRHYSRCALD